MNRRRVVLMVAGFCLFASQVSAFELLFKARVNYAENTYPAVVRAADFDGDGKPDLAVANTDVAASPQSCDVSVLKNNGDGTFAAPVFYHIGQGYLTSLCAVDSDGDEKLDLAVVNSDMMYGNAGRVSVLKNNGDGTFAAAVDYVLGRGFLGSICAADFDGDGRPDLAVANADSSHVSILKNNGDGTFAAAVNFAAGDAPRSVCAADFNGDGKSDLAVGNHISGTGSGNISILKNNGDGTFGAPADYGVGSRYESTYCVTAVDLDGDGKADLAAANYNSKDISVLKNNGDGTFAPAVAYALGKLPVSVCAADFDGDEKPELAVPQVDPLGSGSESFNVSVLKNNGDGTFAAPIDYVVGSWPTSVCAADFDGDGKPDMAVANNWAMNVSILKNKGDGTFLAAIECPVGSDPESLCAADFDRDGKPDLAMTNYYSNNVSILKSNGDGTFAVAVDYGVGNGARSVCAADFDGDADHDLAVANAGSHDISILKNNGDGTFAAAVNYFVRDGFLISLCAADVDGDGRPDLAVANYDSNSVSVLKNNGDGTFAAAVDHAVGNGPSSVSSADFDGDGKPDLAVANLSSGDVSILKNKGDGTFAAAVNYAAGGGPWSVCAADFDGDGKPDLAVGNYWVSILKNNGDGTFAAAVHYVGELGPYISVCAADFDGDGNPDLAAVNWWWYDDISVLKNNGDGTFSAAVEYGVGRSPLAVCSADFNGDGGNDLAVTNVSNSVSILINTRSRVATLLQSYHAALAGNSVCVSWALSEIDEDARFSILRAQEPSWKFEELTDASIEVDGLSFTFIDAACLPGSRYRYRVDFEAQGNPRKTLFETEIMATPSLSATLYQNCPNPFNPSTLIKYYVPEKGRVAVEIYDVSGKRIAQLVREEQEKGFHVVKWNGVDDRGNAAASGVYFCRLSAGKEMNSRKIILVR